MVLCFPAVDVRSCGDGNKKNRLFFVPFGCNDDKTTIVVFVQSIARAYGMAVPPRVQFARHDVSGILFWSAGIPPWMVYE